MGKVYHHMKGLVGPWLEPGNSGLSSVPTIPIRTSPSVYTANMIGCVSSLEFEYMLGMGCA